MHRQAYIVPSTIGVRKDVHFKVRTYSSATTSAQHRRSFGMRFTRSSVTRYMQQAYRSIEEGRLVHVEDDPSEEPDDLEEALSTDR